MGRFRFVAAILVFAALVGCDRRQEIREEQIAHENDDTLVSPAGRYATANAAEGAIYVIDTRKGTVWACQKTAGTLSVDCGLGAPLR